VTKFGMLTHVGRGMFL